MNSTRISRLQFKCAQIAGRLRRTFRWSRTEGKVVNLEIQFGEEASFDAPIWKIIQTRVQVPG